MPADINSVTVREVVLPDNVTLKPQHYTQVQFKVGMHGPFTFYYPTVSFNAEKARQDMEQRAADLVALGAHGVT